MPPLQRSLPPYKRRQMKKRIHVNQHNIRANAKDGGGRPVISVKTYKRTIPANHVYISGDSVVVYRPDHPLSCGAHVWIETTADVIIDGDYRI